MDTDFTDVWIAPLSPTGFLERSARIYPGRTAVIYGEQRRTYAELDERVRRLAGGLRALGVEQGDRVAFLCPNTPPLLVAHFAVPLPARCWWRSTPASTRDEVGYICDHSGAQDAGGGRRAGRAGGAAHRQHCRVEEVVTMWTRRRRARACGSQGRAYEDLLARGRAAPLPGPSRRGRDDLDQLHLGTTGKPKGVMYTHRGAYLNASARSWTAGHERAHRLPLDAADVPLQRLVLPVGGRGRRRRARLPARASSRPTRSGA